MFAFLPQETTILAFVFNNPVLVLEFIKKLLEVHAIQGISNNLVFLIFFYSFHICGDLNLK